MPKGRKRGSKLKPETIAKIKAKYKERKEKWGGNVHDRGVEVEGPFEWVGITVSWNYGRRILPKKAAP